ncbi:hypothetical protein PWE32_06910 [Streptomyces neyagawaensis]|uniref:hypothetical protein n=2 Tax=Streptomyces neyagawaensis TaxID=42238 RepID=UPI0006E18DA5|nr:hypothetical protein [Streptomyces neyagawaensis]MDE1682053.1 hypothetical protein [Streptomyces neyagawaensis]
MRIPQRMRYTTLPRVPAVPVGRQRDWIAVPMGAPTVWMATPDGLACLDLIAVERAVNGLRKGWTLTADEARYAATVLFERGLPYSVVANRVGVSGATMQDWFPEYAVPLSEGLARPRGNKREPRAPRQPRQPARCGTKAGYHAHYRRGEKPCDPCREAKAVAHRHYRKHGTYVGAPEVAA